MNHPPSQPPIFGQIMKLSDAPKITSFGHISMLGSKIIDFIYSKVKQGLWDLWTPAGLFL